MAQDLTACDLTARPGALATLDLQAIGATGPSPRWPPARLQEVLLRWMRWHFGAAERILADNLKARVWVDAPESPILIQSLAEYGPDTDPSRPAVLVEMAGQEPAAPRSIDNGRMIGGCGPGNASLTYSRLWTGRHLVHCIGGKEGEGLELAGEVLGELDGFAPIVRPRVCLERLEVTGVGDRRKLEEYKETWTLPIGIVYGYFLTRRVTPLDVPDLTAARIRTTVT